MFFFIKDDNVVIRGNPHKLFLMVNKQMVWGG
jgi:hypothetical protein